MNNKMLDLMRKEDDFKLSCLNLLPHENILSNFVKRALSSDLSGVSHNLKSFKEVTEANAKKLFSAKYCNVLPLSKEIANSSVYKVLLKEKDRVLVITFTDDNDYDKVKKEELFNYDFKYFSVSTVTGQLNYQALRTYALKIKPKLIVLDFDSYLRNIDFTEIRDIANELSCKYMIDLGFNAGLIASGIIKKPVKIADVVTLEVSGTLGGPQGGIILSNSAEIINKTITSTMMIMKALPTTNLIAAKGVCLGEALSLEFINKEKQLVKNAKILSDVFKMEGLKVVSNGTDNHQVLIDVKHSVSITGKEAQIILEKIGILCTKHLIPGDVTNSYITSGIMLSSSYLTSAGFSEKEFIEIAKIVAICLKNSDNNNVLQDLRLRVEKLLNQPSREVLINE